MPFEIFGEIFMRCKCGEFTLISKVCKLCKIKNIEKERETQDKKLERHTFKYLEEVSYYPIDEFYGTQVVVIVGEDRYEKWNRYRDFSDRLIIEYDIRLESGIILKNIDGFRLYRREGKKVIK